MRSIFFFWKRLDNPAKKCGLFASHVRKKTLGIRSAFHTNDFKKILLCQEKLFKPEEYWTLRSKRSIQQRDKILPEAFITLFHLITRKACPQKLYKGLRLLAADGSDIQIPTNPNDTDSYFPGSAGQEPYNLLHLNALYDLNADVYIDADIGGKRCCAEVRSLCKMVDRSSGKRALVIADRGYESYNLMAHIQEKHWFFLLFAAWNIRSVFCIFTLKKRRTFSRKSSPALRCTTFPVWSLCTRPS